jgi:CheY-like chemotaxis protein
LCHQSTFPAKNTTQKNTVKPNNKHSNKHSNNLSTSLSKPQSKLTTAVNSSCLSHAILERVKQVRLAKYTNEPTPSKEVISLTGKHGDFQALVVDDSAAIRKQLEIELRPTAIQADYAVCGEDALEKIQQKQYDLIFLDIIMPGIDGYEVCKTLRKMSNYKRTPVIMLSGKVGPLDEVEGILAGASTYLLKPVKHQHFQETLARISKWLSEFA